MVIVCLLSACRVLDLLELNLSNIFYSARNECKWLVNSERLYKGLFSEKLSVKERINTMLNSDKLEEKWGKRPRAIKLSDNILRVNVLMTLNGLNILVYYTSVKRYKQYARYFFILHQSD